MKIIQLLAAFCLFQTLLGHGQQLIYENYSTHNGMPSSEVYDLFQDKNGVLWFATDRGVATYDGNKFNKFDKTDGIPSSTVFKFFPQKDGKVWCATMGNKWFWFEDGESEFNAYEYNDTLIKYAKGALFFDFIEDNRGVKHFSFWKKEGVLSILPNGEVVSKLLEKLKRTEDRSLIQEIDDEDRSFSYLWKEGVPTESIFGSNEFQINLKEIGYGFTKFSRVDSVFVYSAGEKLILSSQYTRKVLDLNARIFGSGKFDEGRIWVATVDGLMILDYNGEIQEHYLEGKQVSDCFRDNNGGIWISTLSNGVYYCRNQFVWLHGSSQNSVFSMSIGKDGPLVTTRDEKLLEFTKKEIVPIQLNTNTQGFSRGVYNQCFDSNIIFEMVKNGIKVRGVQKDTFFSMTNVNISNDPEKMTLAVGQESLLIIHPEHIEQVIFEKDRMTAVEWGDHGVYLGTMSGIFFLDTATLQYHKINDERLNKRIQTIKRKGSSYFIGTREDGLIRMIGERLEFVNESNGLSSNLVNDVFPISDSTVWVATSKGLSHVIFGKDGLRFRLIDKSNGVPDNDVTGVLEQNGRVWIGTRSGVCSIDQLMWEKFNRSTLNLHLRFKNLFVEGKAIKWSKDAVFSSEQNSLDFDLGLVSFAANDHVRIRYRLNDSDNWVYTTHRRLSFSYLRPGTYHLVIQASTTEDDWDENELTYSFTIQFPFYRTWWFLALMVVLFVVLVYLFFRYRVLIYNKDLVRKILLHFTRKFTSSAPIITIREQGRECKIKSSEVLFVKSNGNYLSIQTKHRRYVTRMKIGDFLEIVPDKLEFLRVNRSFIIRLDKVSEHSRKVLWIGEYEIPIGFTYQKDVSLMLKGLNLSEVNQ